MNIQQRLTKLEQVTCPPQDTRGSLLVRFIGNDESVDLAGILYIYGGAVNTEYRLNTRQLTEYEISKRNGNTESWLNTVHIPTRGNLIA